MSMKTQFDPFSMARMPAGEPEAGPTPDEQRMNQLRLEEAERKGIMGREQFMSQRMGLGDPQQGRLPFMRGQR